MSRYLTPTAQHIEDLARTFGVVYERHPMDDWAVRITQLCGDDVAYDEVLDLLVALRRAGVVTAREMARFCVLHIREKAALVAPPPQ